VLFNFPLGPCKPLCH